VSNISISLHTKILLEILCTYVYIDAPPWENW
jgi:hypothetical protein